MLVYKNANCKQFNIRFSDGISSQIPDIRYREFMIRPVGAF